MFNHSVIANHSSISFRKRFRNALVPVLIAAGLSTVLTAADFAGGFTEPGSAVRPWAYWNWLNGAVSHADLTRDLEEAKAKGLGGLEIWDCEAMRNADGFVPAGPAFLGPESLAAIRHTIREAERLGLGLGMIASSGWNAGGPWVPPAFAGKNLYISEVTVPGGASIERPLPFPKIPEGCPKGEDGLPEWSLEVAVLAWPDTADKRIPDQSQVINVSERVENGVLRWDAPPGTWRIVRFVSTNNGQQLIAASPNSKGPFIDFLDPEATRFHFEYIIGKLGLKKGGDSGPLKYLEVDSMELSHGIQWTAKFPEWFRKHHDYDLLPWLPALVGWTVTDDETSERFRYDYRKTVSDLLIFSHYTTGSAVCAEYGMALCAEAGGPGPPIWNSCPVDALKALGNVDITRGEFWIESPRNIFLIKQIASAANIYGKPYVDAESWTTWRRWTDGPFALKKHVDRAFCEGLNRITYHVFGNSPEEYGYPGRAYHAGIDLNPRTVWWSKARPFMDYLSRSCHMLRQGRFVADVVHYYGDQAPNFWPMHHDVPEKPLLPGLGAGYDYDVVNSDVILNHMSVIDGRIHLESGMSYRVLVLPEQDHMPLEVLGKLEQLVAGGATIIGPKPTRVPGFTEHEARGSELRALAERLWGECDGVSIKENRHGEGAVVWGVTPREWLASQSIGPDFSCPDPQSAPHLDFIHRQTHDDDIYFVRNLSTKRLRADCVFRVSERAPQLWHPGDGRIEPVFVYQKVAGGTRVPLDLPPGGSVFVVFTSAPAPAPISSLARDGADTDPTLPAARIVALDDSSVTLECWQKGTYQITRATGDAVPAVVDDLPAPLAIDGAWTVAFDPQWGAPAKVELPRLIPWTEHSEHGVKHYSGTGIYTRGLEVPAAWLADGRRVHLDLGDVREVAEIFVNGKSAGVLWKPPFRADITSIVKPGANELKIEVMNLWINRLAGDLELPVGERFTRTNIPFTGPSWKRESWSVKPAGLLGPVRLLPSVQAELRF